MQADTQWCLKNAKQTIESFNGTYQIESAEGAGATVIITLPRANAPEWFVQSLNLDEGQTIVATDDDHSILEIWKQRFGSLVEDNKINLLTFSSGVKLGQWISENKTQSQSSLYLVDYEFLGQPTNGLELIEKFSLSTQSILVTSRYEEKNILNKCEELKVKLIPKGMAPLVPIKLEAPKPKIDLCLLDDDDLVNRPIETNSSPIKIATEKNRYDLCLIDDDQELIGMVWAMEAAAKGLKIKLFATPQAFVAEADKIEQQTPIYIDVSLGNGVSGLDVAHDVHKMGFTEINLATGHQADSMLIPPFICRVVGKDFPDVGFAGAPTC